MRFVRVVTGVTVVAVLSWVAFANAQVAGAENEAESDESGASAAADGEAPNESSEELFQDRAMDEIEVVVGPQGQSAFELEAQRQAIIREVVLVDMRMRERLEQEFAWRREDPDLRDSESRIKWGYSPQAEQRMRRDTAFMNDLSMDRYEPVSIFRVEF